MRAKRDARAARHDSPRAHHPSLEDAISPHCFYSVAGACWNITATNEAARHWMQILMICTDRSGEETNAELVLRRTERVRCKEQEQEEASPQPRLRPQEAMPQ